MSRPLRIKVRARRKTDVWRGKHSENDASSAKVSDSAQNLRAGQSEMLLNHWRGLCRLSNQHAPREDKMSDEPLMPSEIRRKVLSQHREIEQMLSELETGVEKLRDGSVNAGQVKRAAYALRGILELHMNFEEAHMVPAINDADGFGPERARHLHAEHADQRAEMDRLIESIREAESTAELAKSVTKLAEMLRIDIEEEEREYVNEKLLSDHLIPSDPFGG
jgi:hypothetical protein